jgi:uncharacterized protein YndB with AHSA1/START domain
MMATFDLQIEIDAPPEEVFDLLADHTKYPLWRTDIIEAKLFTERPIKKGSEGMTRGMSRGREYVNEIVYYEYDRPRLVSGGTTSGNFNAKMTNRFTPTDSGTMVDFSMDLTFKGIMRLLQPFLISGVKQQFRDDLEALKEYISKNR